MPDPTLANALQYVGSGTFFIEEKWKQDRRETVQFGIISDKKVRESLKSNNIYRNIEDMKKSRPIWDHETFVAIENGLEGDYKNFGGF